ncbi:MAG: glycosyltransferase family 2 protein [Flavobacteriales bacterium]|nr:glycosyltransferase family 2 protein [Flavobacteriales bacterium]
MISVVIPCLNESAFIDAALTCLSVQQDPGEPWEAIVVDGGSQDGTRDILEEWSNRDERIRWIPNPQRTTPIALNLGIAASEGQTILILGAHAEVAVDFLKRNAELLKAHPESGCVGGVVQQVHGTAQSSQIGSAMSTPFGVGDARFRTGGIAGHVDTVAFGAYRKEALDEIGWFDEELSRNQDDELNFRLLKSGWRIWFDPRIQSTYHVRGTFSKLYRQYHQYGYWKVLVNRKHQTITTWRQTIPAIFLAVLDVSFGLWILEALGYWSEPWNGLGGSVFLSATFLWLVLGVGSAIGAAHSPRDILGILRAYAMIHLGYGIGYWQGVLRFLVLRAKPKQASSKLTR